VVDGEGCRFRVREEGDRLEVEVVDGEGCRFRVREKGYEVGGVTK